jgi:hypothetical protein
MKIRSLFAVSLASVALGLGAYTTPASGEMVATEGVAPASQERERVKALVSRPEVARKLEALGVLPKDAAARVDALTEEEVRSLAARIDTLPAGAMSDENWLLVIIVILLIIIAL